MIENGLKNPLDQHGYSSRKSYLGVWEIQWYCDY